ncbi:MAG: RdgB/HAM1 family non-canonical purine NTP pyrophosphatase [Eubacteriales bacterium]|nr:RdgB/HAM1 family non-canonical purine NTP pyrophosphatase [Eubacteriales bacterium]
MKLIIASNNEHKVKEIREILGSYFSDMVTLKEAGVDIDVIEDGTTFEQNAIKKAVEVLALCSNYDAALADDSGLMVDALDGAPGVYSARFAGEGHDTLANNAKLMEMMVSVPKEKRTARFASSVALARRNKEIVCVTGYCQGEILFEARGQNGFGYDPYFFYPPLNKSFAELTSEQKNSVSHRHQSLLMLKEHLDNECENWSLF